MDNHISFESYRPLCDRDCHEVCSKWHNYIIALLSSPLVIWNAYILTSSMSDYAQVNITPKSGEPTYTEPEALGVVIVFSAILINLLGSIFALVSESAYISEKLANSLYAMSYLFIASWVFAQACQLLNILWPVSLFLFLSLFGFALGKGLNRFSLYHIKEKPLWLKPILYGCLAAIPLLLTSSQCKESNDHHLCLEKQIFGGRVMDNDYYSFVCMIIFAILSAIPDANKWATLQSDDTDEDK